MESLKRLNAITHIKTVSGKTERVSKAKVYAEPKLEQEYSGSDSSQSVSVINQKLYALPRANVVVVGEKIYKEVVPDEQVTINTDSKGELVTPSHPLAETTGANLDGYIEVEPPIKPMAERDQNGNTETHINTNESNLESNNASDNQPEKTRGQEEEITQPNTTQVKNEEPITKVTNSVEVDAPDPVPPGGKPTIFNRIKGRLKRGQSEEESTEPPESNTGTRPKEQEEQSSSSSDPKPKSKTTSKTEPAKPKKETKNVDANRTSLFRNERSDTYRRDFIKANPPFKLPFYGECYVCSLCFKLVKIGDMQVDHIIPVSKGGSNQTFNLGPLCAPCNRDKSNKIDSRIAQMFIVKTGGAAIGVPLSIAFKGTVLTGKAAFKVTKFTGKWALVSILSIVPKIFGAFMKLAFQSKILVIAILIVCYFYFF